MGARVRRSAKRCCGRTRSPRRIFANSWSRAAGARIREYLLGERGLTPETIATLGIGYAPASRDGLRQRLLKVGFAPGLALMSGLVSRRDDGTEVDRFRNRLMIPITRDTGSVIAFGGRALEKDQVPKYLNSPETPIYSKSRTLYGLSLTKADLRKTGWTTIVEGYFDFAQVFQAGGIPVVATCGTALTPAQARLLRRFATKTVLCYDPDAAGQGAAERSSELLVDEGFDVNVALLGGGQDPDTFVQTRGRAAYVAQLKRSKPYLEFLLDRAAIGPGPDPRRAATGIPEEDAVGGRADSRSGDTRPVCRSAGAQGPGHRGSRAQRDSPGGGRAKDRALAGAPSLADRARSATSKRACCGGWCTRRRRRCESSKSLNLMTCKDLGHKTCSPRRTRWKLVTDVELPGALMERLTDQEQQLLAKVAAERESGSLSLPECAASLREARLGRELADIQRQLEHPPAEPGALDRLLRRKNELRTELDRARRGPRDVYNK